jgi:hypothetical protein
MADIDLKTETPDTTLPTDGFLFGADSQSAASPSVYPVANAITTFVGNLQSSDLLAWNSDTILTRRAAANLNLGAADAAAPVAQTLSVQSVSSGTTDTAGANLTIAGSQGTGTGAGGSIVFQVAPAGASGTAQNALVTALTIDASRRLFIDGGGSAPIAVTNTSSNVLEVLVNSGNNRIARFNSSLGFDVFGDELAIYGHNLTGDTRVSLSRDATDQLGQRRGTNAQTFRVYNTFTSATNFERAKIAWASNVLQIGTEKGAGGGTARALELQTDGTTRLTIATDGAATFSTSVSTPTVTASSTAANTSAIASTGYSLTGSSAVSLVDLAGTWNTTGTPTALKLNITDTASDAASLLMDLQVGGTSKAKIDKDGDVTTTGSVTTAAPAGGTAAAWKLGARVADTTTLDTTQYIEVDVGGTLYKLALVTV